MHLTKLDISCEPRLPVILPIATIVLRIVEMP